MSLDPVQFSLQIAERERLACQITTKVYSATKVNDTLKLGVAFVTKLTLSVTLGDFVDG